MANDTLTASNGPKPKGFLDLPTGQFPKIMVSSNIVLMFQQEIRLQIYMTVLRLPLCPDYWYEGRPKQPDYCSTLPLRVIKLPSTSSRDPEVPFEVEVIPDGHCCGVHSLDFAP